MSLHDTVRVVSIILGIIHQAALIDHMGSPADEEEAEEEGQDAGAVCRLTLGTLRKHLRLDSAAASAVTLLPDPAAPHQFGSLFNVLNRWVRRPSDCVATV